MPPALPHSSADRIRSILEDLDAVRENLLALSDDIWRGIDHNDDEALAEGIAFKKDFNRAAKAFTEAAAEVTAVVRNFTNVGPAAAEVSAEADARIVQELDTRVPHGLDEDFTYKRPHGFTLAGRAAVGVRTWKQLYLLVCETLADRDASVFPRLPDDEAFMTSRGHRLIARSADEVREAAEVAPGVFAEVNLSANHIRDQLVRLLTAFGLTANAMKVYLREDRDAA